MVCFLQFGFFFVLYNLCHTSVFVYLCFTVCFISFCLQVQKVNSPLLLFLLLLLLFYWSQIFVLIFDRVWYTHIVILGTSFCSDFHVRISVQLNPNLIFISSQGHTGYQFSVAFHHTCLFAVTSVVRFFCFIANFASLSLFILGLSLRLLSPPKQINSPLGHLLSPRRFTCPQHFRMPCYIPSRFVTPTFI